MEADQILGRIDLERALEQLSQRDRAMVLLIYELDRPVDYAYHWPPRLVDIGRYIGLKYHGRVLSESTIRYRQQALEAMWQGKRGPLRQNYLKIDLHQVQLRPKSAKIRQKGMGNDDELTKTRAYQVLLDRYAPAIRRLARKYGKADDDLVEDLQQVGRITLWELDLDKVKSNEDAFVRQAIKYRMIDWLRSEGNYRKESLDSKMSGGAQVVKDATGKAKILPAADKKQWSQPRGERFGWTEDDE